MQLNPNCGYFIFPPKNLKFGNATICGPILNVFEFLKLSHHLNTPKSSKLPQLYCKLWFSFFPPKIWIFNTHSKWKVPNFRLFPDPPSFILSKSLKAKRVTRQSCSYMSPLPSYARYPQVKGFLVVMTLTLVEHFK